MPGFAYLGEVLEQRVIVPAGLGGPAQYGWYFKQAVPEGATVILFANGAFTDSITNGAAAVTRPSGGGIIDVFRLDAISEYRFGFLPLGFNFPAVFRFFATEEVQANTILVNVVVDIMGGHAFTGLSPFVQINNLYSDGVGLAQKARENFLFDANPSQAPEALTLEDGTAEGALTTLAIETSEARHWRLVGFAQQSVALTSGSWAFIGFNLASFHGPAAPAHFPALTPASGWTALQPRYSRQADDLKSSSPPPAFPGPISFPFYRHATDTSVLKFLGSLSANWRSGTLFVAYKLSSPSGLWPYNLFTPQGTFYRTSLDTSGNVWVRRSFSGQPPFDQAIQATTGFACERPSLFWDDGRQRLHLLYGRDSGVWESYSDDDGQTWSTASLVMANARFPLGVVETNSGNQLRVAYLAGTLQGIFTPSGEAARSAVTLIDDADTPLAVDEDSFGLAWRDDDQSRILLSPHISGDDDISEWVCFDGGEHCRFQRIT